MSGAGVTGAVLGGFGDRVELMPEPPPKQPGTSVSKQRSIMCKLSYAGRRHRLQSTERRGRRLAEGFHARRCRLHRRKRCAQSSGDASALERGTRGSKDTAHAQCCRLDRKTFDISLDDAVASTRRDGIDSR